MRRMFDARHLFGLRRRVGPQLVGDHHPWSGPLALEPPSHQLQSCTLVSPVLQEGIENVTIGIDGLPELVFFPLMETCLIRLSLRG